MSFPQIYNLRNTIQEAFSLSVLFKKEQVQRANYVIQVPMLGLRHDQIIIEKDGDFIILSGWNNSFVEPVRFEQIIKTREGSKIQNIIYTNYTIQISLEI